jgi:hypothetical protein
MDLYEPMYVERPMVEVPTMAGVAPRMYGGAELALERAKPGAAVARAEPSGGGGGFGGGGGPTRALSGIDFEARKAKDGGGIPFGSTGEVNTRLNASFGRALEGGNLADFAPEAIAAGVEVGEVFQYELSAPITLERQKSAMLPILTAGTPARRVSIFSTADGLPYPMRGVELTNSSGMQLIPGPIAVFDGAAYAGDAQVGHVPAGDKRLLAYAVDLDVEVSQAGSATRSEVRSLRVVNGVLEQTSKLVNTNAFLFSNKDEKRGRTMIVEVARGAGWTLVDPKEPTEKTEQMYRFELEIPARKATPFKVVQEMVQSQMLAFADIGLPQLVEYRKQGKVSEAVVKAFTDVAARRQAIDEAKAVIARNQEERKRITEDQARVRQNMSTVGQSSEIYARYLQKFTEQENTLEQIEAQTKKVQGDVARMEAELVQFLGNLNVE